MKTYDHFFILAEEHNRCPDCMDEHQDDCKHACPAVDVILHSTRYVELDTFTGCIEYKADPEENQM